MLWRDRAGLSAPRGWDDPLPKKIDEQLKALTAACEAVDRQSGSARSRCAGGEVDPPQPTIVGFIDAMRAEGHAVESICPLLSEQSCQIAARTYPERTRPDRPVAARTITDALVISLFKTECIRTTVFHPGPYKTISDVEYATAGWIDWYNNRRLHSSLGYMPPAENEAAHYATLSRGSQPV